MNITALLYDDREFNIAFTLVILFALVIGVCWIKLTEDIIITKDGYIVKTHIVPIRGSKDTIVQTEVIY